MIKKISILLMMLILISSLSACTEAVVEEEITERAQLNISDVDYYKQLYGQNVSINVYNWGEYIADGSEEGILDVNTEFTNLTGVKVNYSTYATNEELYAKLKGNASSYDIIIPSDYMISRMIKEGMLEELDFENIPNFKNITGSFINPDYDPENRYSVPYTWGTVGIIYDKTVIDDSNFGWEILWDEKYKDRILMLIILVMHLQLRSFFSDIHLIQKISPK